MFVDKQGHAPCEAVSSSRSDSLWPFNFNNEFNSMSVRQRICILPCGELEEEILLTDSRHCF